VFLAELVKTVFKPVAELVGFLALELFLVQTVLHVIPFLQSAFDFALEAVFLLFATHPFVQPFVHPFHSLSGFNLPSQRQRAFPLFCKRILGFVGLCFSEIVFFVELLFKIEALEVGFLHLPVFNDAHAVLGHGSLGELPVLIVFIGVETLETAPEEHFIFGGKHVFLEVGHVFILRLFDFEG